MERKQYKFISKETRINPNTGMEIPCESLMGPCELVAVDEKYYYIHIKGQYEMDVPVVDRMEKARYDIKKY